MKKRKKDHFLFERLGFCCLSVLKSLSKESGSCYCLEIKAMRKSLAVDCSHLCYCRLEKNLCLLMCDAVAAGLV